MSARARPPRRSTASAVSYADPLTSDEEDGEGSDWQGGGGGKRGSGRVPSKRVKGKGKAVDVDDDDDDGDEDEPPRKKARAAKKGVKKAQKQAGGKLAIVNTLPVELLTEIFSHVDPNDLLALSSVNKQYRALLTAKSSARLWKAARDRLDLPDVIAGGLTEWQYAQLVFGRNCQECGAANVRHADFGIRKRLCKACRTASIIRLDWKQNRGANIHPYAEDCVLSPLHTAAEPRWVASAPLALLADLEFYSDKLWELEYAADDESSDEDAAREQRSPSAVVTTSRGRAVRSTRTAAGPSYAEDSSEEDEYRVRLPKRVLAFVEARRLLRSKISQEGTAMRIGAMGLPDKLRERESKKVSFDTLVKEMDRAEQIEQRVFDLDAGFDERDFTPAFYAHKLVKREEALTNEEWDRIKPEILKLMQRIGRKREKDARLLRLQGRQCSLRPRYNKLKKALPPSARPFMPLFVDFLVLPAVKELWQDEDITLDDQTWLDHLDEIKEEVEQFRLDLALRARELIATATRDPDDAASESPADEDDAVDFGPAYFARATSFVCCGFTGCHETRVMARGAPEDSEDDGVGTTSLVGTVGPLPLVLAHQHARHNDASCLGRAKHFTREPQLRLELPLEVACAVGALVDFAQLDPAEATHADIVRFDKLVREYEWENATSWQRHFSGWTYGDRAWAKLLYKIKTEADRAAKAKPPLSLEPPVIVAHLSRPGDWDRLPLPPTPVAVKPKPKGKKVARLARRNSGTDSDDDTDSDYEPDSDDEPDSDAGSTGEWPVKAEQDNSDDEPLKRWRYAKPDSEEDGSDDDA